MRTRGTSRGWPARSRNGPAFTAARCRNSCSAASSASARKSASWCSIRFPAAPRRSVVAKKLGRNFLALSCLRNMSRGELRPAGKRRRGRPHGRGAGAAGQRPADSRGQVAGGCPAEAHSQQERGSRPAAGSDGARDFPRRAALRKGTFGSVWKGQRRLLAGSRDRGSGLERRWPSNAACWGFPAKRAHGTISSSIFASAAHVWNSYSLSHLY